MLPGVYLMLPVPATQAQLEIAVMVYGGPDAAITGTAALRFYGFRQIPRSARDGIDLLIPKRIRRVSTGQVRVHRTQHPPPCVLGDHGRRYVRPARAVAEVTVGIRSAPEADLRDLLRTSCLPLPLFNPRLYLPGGTFIACPDAWWPEAGVAIEVDSRRWHLSPADWEHTMTRHSTLGQYGIVTLHVTPHQLRTVPAPFLLKAANAYKTGKARPRLTIMPAAAGIMVHP